MAHLLLFQQQQLCLRLETIANLADGLDMGWVSYLVSQRVDATVNAALGDEDVVAPDRVEDLVARERPAGLLHKQSQ